MPKYKKKKHNRILSAPKKRIKPPVKKRVKDDDIVMTPSKPEKKKEENKAPMRVVAGKKGEKSRKFKKGLSIVAVFVAIFLVIQIILPAGIVQTVSNLTAVVGTGSYPLSVSGSETLSVVPFDNYYFHLTDTHISAYSSGGKILFSEAHGYERPVLATSKGRALLYNQGGEQFLIYDLKGERENITTKNKIICGAISDSGKYAIVTYSDSYAAAVTVYNKRNKVIFQWFSAEDTINNIAFSGSGRKIALSTFNSNSGVFNSKVNVINFKSATPEFTKSYEGQIIYGLKTGNKSNFSVIKSNGIDFIKWSNGKIEEYKDDYDIGYYRINGSKNVTVFTRGSDKTDNKIVIFTRSGKIKSTVRYKGVINDIQVKGSNIYCISDTTVSVMDFDGNVKFTADYGFGGTGISVLSANVVAVITDSEIKRIKLKQGD